MSQDLGAMLDREARLRWLSTRHAGSIVAGLSILPQSYFHALGTQSFTDWRDGFERAYDELRGQHDDDVTRLSEKLQHGAPDEAERLIDLARNAGVAARWKFEQLFAVHGGDAASSVLTYGNTVGGQLLNEQYDNEQLSELRAGARPMVDGQTLVGHHINSVRSTLNAHDPRETLHRAMDPDNIKIVTPARHFVEHGGNFRSPTSGKATEVADRHDALLTESTKSRTAEALGKADAHDIDIALAVGLAAGSVSAVIRLWQLRADPRPWQQKAGLAAIALAEGTASGILVSMGAQAGGHFARELMADCALQFSDSLGDEASAMVLTDLVGSGVAMGAGSLIRVGFRAITDLRQGRPAGQVRSNAAQQLARVGVEQVGFLLVGVFLDSLTPIPDPVVGPIVTILRITYSVCKLGFLFWNERESALEIRLVRIEWMVRQARLACA